MKKLLILLTALLFVFTHPGLAKNEKKNKVKAVTAFATVYENGKALTVKESYEEFNKNGKSVLKIDYKKDGSIDQKKTFKYNASNDKIEEIEYNAAGSVMKKTVFTYDADGDKISETTTDSKGNLISKSLFSYNAKKLKTEKKTYTVNNILESVKKWEYVHY